ncbi:MAG: hypothetical protein KJ787_13895 [Gammaproteobacteria bacterium]|nr:hypothetical protein [Gammaproteobacteria bacterium]MBU1647419.1 hypothetical protein [Gammaproteobacteria bacterium]MBU1973211.1 hypothetical protein [Gammaproteobacteria bacterium]
MTAIAWPTLTRSAPRECEWRLKSNTVAFQSPLSGATQTVEFPGARWEVSFAMENLLEADTALLRAFMARLRGRAGRFTLHNFARPTPRGTISGTPLVKGAGQSGTTLLIDGCTVGTTLLAGDFIGVNGELKMVVADATADGSGEMTLTLEPPLRASPADNATITTNQPTATFMLSEDAFAVLTRPGLVSTVAVSAVECWT